MSQKAAANCYRSERKSRLDLSEGVAGITEASFRALFEAHYASLCRRLALLMGDPSLAEDVVQEAFLKLYRSPPAELTNPGAWLARVAVNLAYNRLRREGRRGPLEARAGAQEAVQTAPSPEEELMAKEKQVQVRAALTALTARDRLALILRYSGYSYAEIAAVIGVAAGSVGTILARAQRSFRLAYLAKEGMR
ncbi:RNA polymerase sigma factor SigX [Gelria sp. Kuro-4]|nr:RNA polymerase sigma factor SigX [Gelria sp. Kuro-4]